MKNYTITIEKLTIEIVETDQKLSKNVRYNIRLTVKQGNYFIKLKKVLKKKKIGFKKYCDEHFPYMLPRTIQRYMMLAKHVDLESHPSLAVLSQNKLKDLIKLNGNKDVGKFLRKNGFKLQFDPEDFSKSVKFRQKVNDFINKQKPKKKSKKKAVTNEKVILQATKWARSEVKQDSKISEEFAEQIEQLRDLLDELLELSGHYE